MSFARAFLSGVVVSAPDKRFTPNNIGVTQFKIQIAGNGNDAPFTVQITCWRQLAEVAANSIQPGDTVMVEGRLQIHQNEQMGQYERFYEVDASNLYKGNMQLLYAGQGQQQSGNMQQAVNSGNAGYPQQQANYMPTATQVAQPAIATAAVSITPDEFITEEDIPF